MSFIVRIIERCINGYVKYKQNVVKKQLGFCGKNVSLEETRLNNPQNIFMYDNTNILRGFSFINHKGRFYFHAGSSAAKNLTVVTDGHIRSVGKHFKDEELFYHFKDNITGDIIVEDEVWIGTNVTLLVGAHIGRGATIGAGTVCSKSIPPYAIVTGNPAKVVGFSFTPDEIIEHEKVLYAEPERLPRELLEKNYEKFFLKRLKEIKEHTKI